MERKAVEPFICMDPWMSYCISNFFINNQNTEKKVHPNKVKKKIIFFDEYNEEKYKMSSVSENGEEIGSLHFCLKIIIILIEIIFSLHSL